jgi:TonB family protein
VPKIAIENLFLTAVGMRAGEAGAPKKNHPNLLILFTLVLAMDRKSLVCLLALFLVQAAHADTIKDALSQKYKDRVLALRTPFARGDQKFNSAGQLLNAHSSDPWLLYGAFQVEKLNLTKDTLRLEGPRVALRYVKTIDSTFLTKLSKSAKVEIHLDHPLNSLDEAQELMDRVFFPEDEVTQHAAPEFRRADDTTPDDQIFHISKNAFHRPGDNAPEAADDHDKEGIILPPRATYTPEPGYSPLASHAKYQGTLVLKIVIDKAGKISRIRLERALGMGLDENAMEEVKRWRFNPATRNGQPVAVEMNIEVSFNLY